MFLWCIVLFHLFLSFLQEISSFHFFQEFVACLQDAQDHLSREWESRDSWKNLHKLIWWAVGRGRAGSCLRQQASREAGVCEAGGHWGHQLVAPSSRRYHLLHPEFCTKAATLKLHPKESSHQQIHIPQVCLSSSHCLSHLMVRVARSQLVTLTGARVTSVFHAGMPWATPSHDVCWLSA